MLPINATYQWHLSTAYFAEIFSGLSTLILLHQGPHLVAHPMGQMDSSEMGDKAPAERLLFMARIPMDSFLKMIFSLPDEDLEDYMKENLFFIDESTRVSLFEELMQMVADLVHGEDLAERLIAERAEKVAGLMNPYDDHQLRGLIRFNTLALDNKTE